jgi:hypothetical protein
VDEGFAGDGGDAYVVDGELVLGVCEVVFVCWICGIVWW